MHGLGRAVTDTCIGEKEKCKAGGGGGRGGTTLLYVVNLCSS